MVALFQTNDSDYTSLQVNSTNALRVHNNKVYSSETSYISGQTVSGSGTHTGSAITNDANITTYLFEHNFSGSDVSFEILESIDNSNFFATGQSFNYIDFLSNGFKIRGSDARNNGSGATYIYMAFAESPFVNSNGIPNNAR